ncbi:hypothetical protein [Agrobacterium tumefaciens]|uniref:hypothetical protein n=1 Tax=Agrobacterium tumefaciens TaxID=358 RepID=UPI0009778AB2|nr:hypothetical protein BV900_14860 [Agrobacterium tumefaciens]
MDGQTNPFLNTEVFAPQEFQTYFQKYSLSQGGSTVDDFDRKPFHRMVDFWFMAIAVAVKKGLKQAELPSANLYKAIDSPALSSSEWRLHALKLIAIAESGNPEIVTDGRAMIRIANGLAFAGMPILIDILENNIDEEAFGLCDALIEMLD